MKLIDNLRRLGENISRWFSYFPVLWKVYDFDYSSILSVERHQIKRVRDSISHYRNHLNWEQDVASMNLALKLLDIIEENGKAKMIGDEPFATDEKGYWKPNPNVRWELRLFLRLVQKAQSPTAKTPIERPQKHRLKSHKNTDLFAYLIIVLQLCTKTIYGLST